MIYNPHHAIENKWITFPDLPLDKKEQLQPNGIDLRVKTIHKLPIHKPFRLLESGKQALDQWQCEGGYKDNKFTFLLDRATPYVAECYERVHLPRNVTGIVFGRSTFNRNGIIIRSALYDSGFNNHVGFVIYPFVPVELHPGVRMCQIIFVQSDSYHLYNGQYQDHGN